MKKNIKLILLLILLIAIAAVLAIWGYYTRQITMNPEGTVGNTAGNLNNGGLFCEYNDTVYFANPQDNYALYSMTLDEQNLTELTDSTVCNILAGGDYIYYFQRSSNDDSLGDIGISHSFFRSEPDGEHAVILTSDVVVTGQLVDNYLYLLTSQKEGPLFYKLKIDKSEKVALAEYQVNPASAYNGSIYYNGTGNNHYLYALNTANDVPTEVLQGNLWYPIADGDYIYFLDVENDYRLCRYVRSQDMVEVLTNDRVDCYNVGSGYIYYQCNSASSPALKMMRTDGSDLITLAEGSYTKIHMTSKYVYFQPYENETVLYHSPIGSGSYSSIWSSP